MDEITEEEEDVTNFAFPRIVDHTTAKQKNQLKQKVTTCLIARLKFVIDSHRNTILCLRPNVCTDRKLRSIFLEFTFKISFNIVERVFSRVHTVCITVQNIYEPNDHFRSNVLKIVEVDENFQMHMHKNTSTNLALLEKRNRQLYDF